ncbi:MAG: ABC-F family ATP-binding cassette domain-containing protein [Deltaproteobacteria bacterium]|nr:ABC-F family ATP-binding cassette domain-containing protein [Deltaproteobacteria bacterium]
MVELKNITLQHGHQVVFLGASMKLNPGEKVGLVGPNGAGKSTLFRLILGEQRPDEGSVDRPKRLSVGWFRQDFADLADRSVLDETIAGAGDIAALGAELAHLEERLGDVDAPDYDEVIERYGDVQGRFAAGGGYDLEARACTLLAGLGFRQDELNGPVRALSGGWRMRVQLARLLLARPELLLLDEPTNYLDIESIVWLEAWLRDYPGCVLLTCHDRDVMNRVVRRVIEIDGGVMRSYTGDYDAYEKARALDAAQREAEYQKQQAMLAKELRFIERFKAQPAKASQVQSRAKKVDKIEKVEPPPRFVERRFQFRKVERSGDEVVKVQGVAKSYGERAIHRKIDLLVRRGERWAIMGENGAGKTTLLKMMAGALAPDRGRVGVGSGVSLGYFAQHQAEQLNDKRTILEELEAHAPMAGRGVIMALAGAFGFTQDDVEKSISVLSGGERSRLVLAKLLYNAPNLLVLDEPTNHLDLTTKRALIKALQEYEGTVVFVSHDRAFLRALATRVVELAPSGPQVYEGSYDEYVTTTGREAPGLRAL